MVKKILILLFLTTMAYSQTYTITEEELQTLETTIETQRKALTGQQKELTALRRDLKTAKVTLMSQEKSFDEYEAGALRIQKILRADAIEARTELKGWRIAVPVSAAVMLIGGFLIGHFSR